jgi:hypothetical protein
MNYFLFGGAVNVGKTETVGRIARYILRKGFQDLLNKVPPNSQPQNDFLALLEGTNSKGEKIRIIVNSPSDTDDNINDLVSFCEAHNPDIIISSVRCEGYDIRKYFFTQLGINLQKDHITELPLASINAQHSCLQQKRRWYRDTIDNIAQYLLAGTPFFI